MGNELTNLAQKIASARVKLGSLMPDKTNKDQNYQYISADKMLERAGDVLSEAGITIVPNVIETNLTAVAREGKSPRIDAVLKMQFQVTDGTMEYNAFWAGCGSDYVSPDKAIYKAITSGHKYFLMKLLNVGVGNEDGEHENEEGEKKQETKTTAPKKERDYTKPGDPSIEEAEAIVGSDGIRYGDCDVETLRGKAIGITKKLNGKLSGKDQDETLFKLRACNLIINTREGKLL